MAQPPARFAEIPALTGLRFVAVMMVTVAHAAPIVTRPEHPWSAFLRPLAPVGMSLFFSLSGYVIWLNYADGFSKGVTRRAVRDFAVARLARLWPMYLVALAIAVKVAHVAAAASALPGALLYVVLLQAWIPANGDRMMAFSIGAAGHFWSVSDEVFLYVLFPLFAVLLSRVRSVTALLWTAAWVVLGFVAAYALAMQESSRIMAAVAPALPETDAVSWLSYYAPWTHVFEFVIGAIACRIFLASTARKPQRREMRMMAALAALSVVLVVAAVLGFASSAKMGAYFRLGDTALRTLPLVPIGFLLFFVSRYPGSIRRLLSQPVMRLGGEFSYSIYLLHPFVIGLTTTWLHDPIAHLGLNEHLRFAAMLAIAAVSTIAVSAVTFATIERPARRYIRARGGIRKARTAGDDVSAPRPEHGGPYAAGR
jgi:peptidoglycan/LPS O-acetylase OafA/YrhL